MSHLLTAVAVASKIVCMADDAVEFVRTEVARFGAELETVAPAVRLERLTALREVVDREIAGQLRAAACSARGEGWGLRRITGVVGVSHEQVRRMLTATDAAAG